MSTFSEIVSNYNLVVHNIGSFILQRSNTPKEAIMCTFTTLQNMDHSVRTALGYVESTYGGDKWSLPLKTSPQGPRQGNGSAPSMWENFSTQLLDCLQ